MVKMLYNGKEYEIAEDRVAKLLRRGFDLVKDSTPETEDAEVDQTDQEVDKGEL